MDFNRVNQLIEKTEKTIDEAVKFNKNEELFVGVDLGTAYIVLVVLNKEKQPIACEMKFAQVLRDGLVVDYIGALNIVRELKEKLEERLGVELYKASIAVPPGTSKGDAKTHKYVVEGAGMEVIKVLDEPTAANAVLQIEDGVIVDIGGGTTGISILKDGKVVYTADEATGGTHLSLVIAGNYKVKFEEAEKMKMDKNKQRELLPIIRPVIQKVSTIIKENIKDYEIDDIYLVGGTCCFEGIEEIIEKEIKIRTRKPSNPFLVTPLGIAMNCCS
ncbi:ethanolamine utilization protein EutJ [Anaerosalibacter bizertensis]|uniref:Chaperone protein DnaK n=1 Tax=Anaerosalibacter bizertensis TaxID=932217 RepID=A0A9Q4FMB6_9FIRM|nr:ethanolamine utilization protein EutJ [Anaerosalibacter bizertensis]MCG4565525.1 ethanolamine utilization protein EutJ [Anaerosalibacter bizertensis]